MKIIMLRGVPASGKSTWAQHYVEEHKEDTVIVSKDAFRHGRGIYWVPNKKQDAYINNMEDCAVQCAINNKLNIIIDSTNLREETMRKWSSVAEKANYEFEVKEFYIPFEEAVKRDEERGKNGGHTVGENEIKKFYRRFYNDRLLEESKATKIPYRVNFNNELPYCIICDIDGTVAHINNRSPYDKSDKLLTDVADGQMFKLIDMLYNESIEIIFLTGREDTEDVRKYTEQWLETNVIQPYKHKLDNSSQMAYTVKMRRKNDYRKDYIVKKEIYENDIKPFYNVLCVFEDRCNVVNMWRENGLLCCQVDDGVF